MPLYELVLILKPIKKPDLVACLRRTAELIWKENGAISKIDFLGTNQTSHKIKSSSDASYYDTGSYFIYHVSLGQAKLSNINPELKLDVDLLKARFFLKDESKVDPEYVCTLPEELLPPVYRPSVKPLLEEKNFRATVRK